jgi:hypothetical protein
VPCAAMQAITTLTCKARISSTGDKYKVSANAKYGKGAAAMKDANGSKPKPQGLQGSSIAFHGDAISGDWSDSVSEESDSEMLLLDRSSSGSDSGSAAALDEASDGGVLTLDALDRSKALPLQTKRETVTTSILGASLATSAILQQPTAPSVIAAAATGTLGRVLAATQVPAPRDSRVCACVYLVLVCVRVRVLCVCVCLSTRARARA